MSSTRYQVDAHLGGHVLPVPRARAHADDGDGPVEGVEAPAPAHPQRGRRPLGEVVETRGPLVVPRDHKPPAERVEHPQLAANVEVLQARQPPGGELLPRRTGRRAVTGQGGAARWHEPAGPAGPGEVVEPLERAVGAEVGAQGAGVRVTGLGDASPRRGGEPRVGDVEGQLRHGSHP